MNWKESNRVSERREFVELASNEGANLAALCRRSLMDARATACATAEGQAGSLSSDSIRQSVCGHQPGGGSVI